MSKASIKRLFLFREGRDEEEIALNVYHLKQAISCITTPMSQRDAEELLDEILTVPVGDELDIRVYRLQNYLKGLQGPGLVATALRDLGNLKRELQK